MPITDWLHYADHDLDPICRSPSGSFGPITDRLELDWSGVCWDADFRYEKIAWKHYSFRGTAWQRTNAEERQLYLKNAYRVILTRARQGMVIYVPAGSLDDPTRHTSYYDQTYDYLCRCGLLMV